jgi:MFS family permease
MAAAEADTQKSWSMKRVVAASSAGTAFEWYDFFIFGSLATTIQKVFFAGLDPTAGLIAALGLFAAGFAFRPLGAIIFGVIGDRLGRKGAFLATVSLMGAATFLIGVLPTYATAGIISPILLILLRILQGIALGGEYGGAAIYVAEHAPNDRRGATTGWIQITASLGLIAGLLVILGTRTAVGDAAFLEWGWRVPFLVSVVLLIISVWLRFKLSESPAFQKLKEEGDISPTPLREAFGRWDNLKRVLIAFFGIMLAQGAVWYLSFFYVQVFLTKSLGVPESTKDALILGITIVSAPLYVFFGWLSDRVGRKPVMIGGMVLALIAYYPGFHGIASAANPALAEAQAKRPVEVHANPANCSVQFDPVGTRRFDTSCDIAKSLLASAGISYTNRSYPEDRTIIAVGVHQIEVPDGRGLDAAGLKALKEDTAKQIKADLAAEGYPAKPDPARMNLPVIFFWLMVFAVAATALYGPQAAALVEMFPTRVRYTAMSLPYHVGTGWIGGFLPVTSFALVAITGDIYASLWYPVVFTIIPILVSLFFLKETRGKPLEEV